MEQKKETNKMKKEKVGTIVKGAKKVMILVLSVTLIPVSPVWAVPRSTSTQPATREMPVPLQPVVTQPALVTSAQADKANTDCCKQGTLDKWVKDMTSPATSIDLNQLLKEGGVSLKAYRDIVKTNFDNLEAQVNQQAADRHNRNIKAIENNRFEDLYIGGSQRKNLKTIASTYAKLLASGANWDDAYYGAWDKANAVSLALGKFKGRDHTTMSKADRDLLLTWEDERYEEEQKQLGKSAKKELRTALASAQSNYNDTVAWIKKSGIDPFIKDHQSRARNVVDTDKTAANSQMPHVGDSPDTLVKFYQLLGTQADQRNQFKSDLQVTVDGFITQLKGDIAGILVEANRRTFNFELPVVYDSLGPRGSIINFETFLM